MIQFNYTLDLVIISLSIILVVYILIKVIYRHKARVNDLYGRDIIFIVTSDMKREYGDSIL